MQYVLEQFGVAVAAVTGALAARGKRVDLFGVIVLAIVTAFGGGTVRDLLIGAPVFWVRDPYYLINASLAAVLTFYIVRFHELPMSVLLVADAFALAFFTMVGTRKGMTFSVAPLIAVAMGVTTGVAGGVLRDLLIGEIPLVFRRETYLYATAAFCGASLFALMRSYSMDPQLNMVVGTATTLVLRLAGIRWQIGLPMFRNKHEHRAASSPPPPLPARQPSPGQRQADYAGHAERGAHQGAERGTLPFENRRQGDDSNWRGGNDGQDHAG